VDSFLGIDIGGTNVKAALVRRDGSVATYASSAWSGGSPEDAVAAVARLVSGLAPGGASSVAVACGCGCAGLVDRARGVVLSSPNLPAWHDVELSRLIEAALGLPAVVENDANAAAYGEYVCGAARGAVNAVMLTLGTGVGGGLILEGRLYRGTHGAAGEIGHAALSLEGPPCPCGSKGCLERFVNAESIVSRARALIEAGRASSLSAVVGSPKFTAKDVAEAAHAGDAVALEALEATGRVLGVGLAAVANVLDPDVIVLGGGVASVGEPLLRPAREELRARLYASGVRLPRVVRAELGESAGVVGAALLAAEDHETS